jgi:hypothetical protein
MHPFCREVSMSKKRTPHRKPPEEKLRRRITKTTAAAILICVVATGAAVSRFEPLRRTLGLSAATTPAQTPPATPTSSKDYIYAGGRLIATEELSPSAASDPPTNLVAASSSTTSVSLTWSAPATGTVSHYIIERAGRGGVTTLGITPNTSPFTDTTAQLDNVYRYRVRAVFAGGGTSNFSNGDLATTFFQSDAVVVGQTVIRAKHFTDLRQAVNDVRLIAGLESAPWSTPAPAIGGSMLGNHVAELRANLEPALAALGVSPTTYTDASPLSGKQIKATHVNELRARFQ